MSTSSRSPNVILILTDDQGYGDLSCHGHPVLRTPALDHLHAESVRLTDFHVAPMCTPTRGALLTGQHCLRNGAMATSLGRHLLRREFPTLADHFRTAGYRTGLFGKWHLGSSYPYRPMDRGFEEALYHQGHSFVGVDAYWNGDYYDPWVLHNGELEQEQGYCTDLWFNRAMEWMSGCRSEGRPFFTYLATNVPHFPMWIEDQYKEDFRTLAEVARDDTPGFYGMIVELDENMARLDEFLVREGLKENTILLFLTDNGHAGGALEVYNAGMRGGKCSRYEGGHRVPCFIRWPGGGLRSPGDLPTPACGEDLLPTLLDLCGIPLREPVDGTTLRPLLEGDDAHLADRKFVVQYFQGSVDKEDACVVWKKWRLVYGKELYDLASDPGQERDVAQAHPEVVAEMKAFYDRWWDGVRERLHEFSPLHVGSAAEPETKLTSAEWMDVRADGTGNPRTLAAKAKGDTRRGGAWKLHVEQTGRYRIELRRYPREARLALSEASPKFEAVAGEIEVGVPAPIETAQLQLDGRLITEPASQSAEAVTFECALREGRHDLQGWFIDREQAPVCGAYFAYLTRIG